MVQPWITVDDLVEGDDPSAAWAVEAACWILYHLSGEKYAGIQSTTEVYTSRVRETSDVGLPVAQLQDGRIIHRAKGSSGVARFKLKHTPIRSIESIKVGGKLMDPSRYQLRNNTHIVRTDNRLWDLTSELEISYTYGVNPPAMGIAAAIRLANEFIWNDQDSEKCTLPERISSSVSRQGVSYTVLDPQDFLDQGRTGITIVDMFINTANPAKAKKRPRVITPDGFKAERIN